MNVREVTNMSARISPFHDVSGDKHIRQHLYGGAGAAISFFQDDPITIAKRILEKQTRHNQPEVSLGQERKLGRGEAD